MERERTGEEEDNQNQRRLKPPENSQIQQQPPQKCPRCDSINTKFCYYNNYSLSQPRFFCKTCRRYWTQGGTLRNVPVGGGCRKGKRAKPSSSSASSIPGENSRSKPPQPPIPQQNLTAPATLVSPGNQVMGNLAPPPVNSYFSGGGFLSSLANMQSLSQTQPNQEQINVGGGGGGQFGNSSNLSLLQGLNFHSFGARQAQDQQIQNPNQIYQMGGNRDQHVESPFYPSDQSLVQPSRPIGGSWNHNSLINNNTNTNQWPDLSGYGPPT